MQQRPRYQPKGCLERHEMRAEMDAEGRDPALSSIALRSLAWSVGQGVRSITRPSTVCSARQSPSRSKWLILASGSSRCVRGPFTPRWSRMQADIEAVKGGVPIKRMGRPEEIADMVLWLCNSGSTYVIGQPIGVDAGRTIQYVSRP